MKLTAIRLTNVRRFVDPVEVTGIGPGLNLLSAPNEHGKSTIFDALHALFFKDAKSWDKEVRALAPHSGGDPEVEVELTHQGSHFRIAKSFTKSAGKGAARIWREGVLLHQADAAEVWLRDLIAPPKEGPVGMLWLRQGLTDFADAKDTLEARRDLMSSLSGEVEAVTGGQQMERLRRRLRSDLDRMVTSRGARKGGPLAEVEARVAALSKQRDALTGQVADLRQLLDQRRLQLREQAELDAPEETAARQSRLNQAETALAAAERHREKCEQARRALDLAILQRDGQAARIETQAERLADHARATTALMQAAERRDSAAEQAAQAAQQLKQAESVATQARENVGLARKSVAAALRAEAAEQAQLRRTELGERLAQFDALQAALAENRQQVGQGIDADALAQLEDLARAVTLAQHARTASAAALSVAYLPGGTTRLRLNGETFDEGGEIALPEGGELEVPGLATVTLHPARSEAAGAVSEAETALATALDQLEFGTLAQARAAHQARLAATARLREGEATQRALAPEGREALVAAIAALPGGTDPQPPCDPLPDRTTLEAALAEAEAGQTRAEADLAKARIEESTAQQSAHGALAEAKAAEADLDRATQALGEREIATTELAALRAEMPALDQTVAEARAEDARLTAAAPDLEQARATCQRARSVVEAAQARLQDLARDLAVLDARISAHASHAVEEELAEVTDQLAVAEARQQALHFEVATLRRLDQALEAAQAGAQAQYLGPLMAELTPLLRRLWPEAEVQVDADSVLPSQLARGAAEEQLTQLSGGTQEQLALMVRLAFARLLAKSGQGIPVILDDALVYTDDARIEALFDALTLQANDLQILVFSCRQKSFRDLGGTSLAIRPADDRD
ncbi:AAA family ATPase [Phaeobacter gallaeciensis]|uniref:AAA domain protein n=1 Tax=Phaeobacter gallaeciensis TaxID=60890 RepID=A0AAC9Z741_9RHOB|nr:AAA family ATPase [Phaeobacter gallaeciensis]AHD08381.1 AAA domain protein [Phaeobacter gallaeciensis DSM 26640]ATE91647.1 AAA domain protein [Phaeobacter gallaeciensis]ATE98529.1 AAA domain protein [Phaeobacter gallaeciensis]ATF00263.1 AAA domain protein [Phaeobacter gallaeciensis]ATF04695.1 AAA domain protein [Phaeobacter gallaeciensis]